MEVQRVQHVASTALAQDTIPPEFIRSEHEQPGLTTFHGHALDVPVIDLSTKDEKELVDAYCKL